MMNLRKITGSGHKPPLYQVRNEEDEIIFKTRDLTDASLVLRFLNGGSLTEEQLSRYCDVMKEAATSTD